MTIFTAKTSWSTMISRGFVFSLLWWILTEGVVPSWWIGIPTVFLASVASTMLSPSVPLVWHRLPGFLLFFAMRSLSGGVDVAWRAFHPDMPMEPDLIEYKVRLADGLSQVFLANIMSLLPGTLIAGINKNSLCVHVLDRQQNFSAEIEEIEQKIARTFGIPLQASNLGE